MLKIEFTPWIGCCLLVWLTVLTGCGDDRRPIAPPAMYLLDHQHWTPVLVLNFDAAIAPGDDSGEPLTEGLPDMEPGIDGAWRWQDPSRLVFFPSQKSLPPDTDLAVSLKDLKLHPSYRLMQSQLAFHTPPLQLIRQTCRWQDSEEPPLRRAMLLSLEFNYPVIKPSFSANLANGSPINVHTGQGTRLDIITDPLVRPVADSHLRVYRQPGTIALQALKPPYDNAEFDAAIECQLPVRREDWDAVDAKKNPAPTITGIVAQRLDNAIGVSLQGQGLTESVTKARAGEMLRSGVTLQPSIEGSWFYGDAADGPDLIFKPKFALTPGTRFTVAIDRSVYDNIGFAGERCETDITTPEMTAVVASPQLYSDPADPTIKRLTATVDFSYPPHRDSLQAKTALQLRRLPAKGFTDALGFEIRYDDKQPNRAFIRSEPLTIGQAPAEVRLALDAGIVSAAGGQPSRQPAQQVLSIPGARDYLQIARLEVNSVVKPDDSIERLIMLQTNVALKAPTDLERAVEVLLLPDCGVNNPQRPSFCQAKDVIEWQSADQVDADIVNASTPLAVRWRDAGSDDKTLQHLAFAAPENRQLLIKVNKGLVSIDGFALSQDARYLHTLGANQRDLKILHEGALLSLSGDKKLGVTARGVGKVRIELQRILPHNLHHIAQFTSGNFQNPDFQLPVEHFAESFGYDETLPLDKSMQRHYFAVDFARFVRPGGFPPRGLFILNVAEKVDDQATCDDPQANDQTEAGDDRADEQDACDGDQADEPVNDKRLVLLTDMGLLVKTAADGKQDVFVMSFRSGQPMAGAQVSLLGKNGVPVFAGKTDVRGHVSFPSSDGLTAEKAPTVYLAEKEGDVSFLPFDRDNRRLDVSRFDIDGLHDRADTLLAYLFSDRGIYRPGDTVNIGLILRKRDWSALPSGLPLKAVISDPEGQEIDSRTLHFGVEGFQEINWVSPVGGKTGTYRVELIVADKKRTSLGNTRIRVEEFQPDRLQVKTDIPDLPTNGWLSPDNAKARVTVRNLFGTVAVGNGARLELTARPWSGQVPGYGDYRFRRSLPDHIPNTPRALGEVKTDDQGEAWFDLPLGSIVEPVFEIGLAGEGFEKGSGRSVVAVTSALVSKQAFLLGYHADGNLDYIAQNTRRALSLVALDSRFQPTSNDSLTTEVYEKRYVSTLVKREDGLYQYQSVLKHQLLQSRALALAKGRAELTLPTENPGQFFVVLKNATGDELNRAEFTVAGEGNVTRNVEHNAELNLTLNKTEYQPGETLEVQIVAPYHGAGLITIEQDGVVASQWFKTSTTASNQTIKLPETLSGNAYLSVAFVRSLDSREIYMSPLSYGVVPFKLSRQRYTQALTLKVPESVQPGSDLEVSYQVKEAGKLVLYAIDEGILQFAHYKNPAPLDYFFRKRALQVRTHQILDLILPDFALVQRLSAPGGDEDAQMLGKYKNPFARKHKPPMAFWSGIIDVAPGTHRIAIPVPDYFNGKIRVIAVAVNAGKVAVPAEYTVASQPFVIQPQQPWVAAPGDEFEMGVLIANNSGLPGNQTVQVRVDAGEALSVLSDNPQSLTLAPGQDGTVRFRAKANDKLGAATVRYRVDAGDRQSSYSEDISLRPAQPLLTSLQGGVLTVDQQRKGEVRNLVLQRSMHDEQRQLQLAVSVTPAAYLRGIVDYLKTYPYGCTEQITSQAFPAVVLGANAELGLSDADVRQLLNRSLRILQTRQKHNGGFGYWTAGDDGVPFYSLYATHLLLEASTLGHAVPDAMLRRALSYADELAQTVYYDPANQQAKAYALYLLARDGRIVTERLRAFDAELQAHSLGSGDAVSSRTRFLLGAAYKLHHLDQDAERQFGDVSRRWREQGVLPADLQNNPDDLSLYLYLAGKHFPELFDPRDAAFGRYLQALAQDLVKQRINAFRGSMALLGLGSLWRHFETVPQSFSVLAGTPSKQLDLQGKTLKSGLLTPDVGPIVLRGDGQWALYYQLSETGYDRQPPTKPIARQLTINRQLLNDKGEPVAKIGLQDKLHIRIALHPDRAMKDLAVLILIPGGFEIDLGDQGLAARKSLPVGDKPLWQPDYIDVQEDRVALFGALDGGEKYFEFRLKPLNAGRYQVPPVFAEGMYDGDILYRGLADAVQVSEP